MGSSIVLILLVALPAWAVMQTTTTTGSLVVLGVTVVGSIFTYTIYAVDKKRAQAGQWRIPEATLHLGAILAGWPGAWIAQRRLRHKNRKGSFQACFWLIVVAYQVVAIDALRDWAGLRALREFLRGLIE